MSEATPDADLNLAPRRQRSWLKTLSLSLVLLVSGGVIGAGFTLIVVLHRVQVMIKNPELFATQATKRLTSALDLSEEQARRVNAILREHQDDIRDIRREVRPQIDRQLDLLREDIARELTPEQAKRWRAFIAKKRRVWMPPP